MDHFFKYRASLLLFAFLPACGGSSSGGNGGQPTTAELVASCRNTCAKMKSCAGDAGGAFINCDQICTEQNFTPRGTAGQSSGPTCDYGKMKAKLDSCADVACSELDACYAEARRICSSENPGSGGSSNGNGGASNGGFPTGNGGSGPTGSGTCADCDTAATCCRSVAQQAGQDPSSCSGFSSATCSGYPAAQQNQLIQACTAILAACP